ncbi:sialyltransferase [Pycnococcus provasolii]
MMRRALPWHVALFMHIRRKLKHASAQTIIRWAVLAMIVVSFVLTFLFVDSDSGGAIDVLDDIDARADNEGNLLGGDDADDVAARKRSRSNRRGGAPSRGKPDEPDDGEEDEEENEPLQERGDEDEDEDGPRGENGEDEDEDGADGDEEEGDGDEDAPRPKRRKSGDELLDGDDEEEDVEPEVVTIQPFHGVAIGGTVVTIRGKHFMGSDVRAEVGGIACASTTVTDAETVLCTTPAGAGARLNVGVRKRTSRGYFVTSRENTLYSYDDPSVESVSPDHGPTEGGSTISVVGTNFGPLDANVPVEASVGGVPCTSTTVVSDSVVVCVTPQGTPGAKSVVVAVGEGEHRAESRRNRLFAYVLSPRERLLEQAGALLDGLTVRFGDGVPMALHRTGVSAPFEFVGKDAFTGKSTVFAVSPDVFDSLPESDWRKDYRRCAVVGHDSSLLDTMHGRRIDSAEAVFRFNNAPTKGYEEYVGTRDSVRLLSTSFLRMVLTRDPHLRRVGLASGGASGWRPTGRQTLVISSPYAMDLGVSLSQAFPRTNVVHLSRSLVSNVNTLYAELRRRFEELGVEGMLTKSSALEAREAFADGQPTSADGGDKQKARQGDEGLPDEDELPDEDGWGGGGGNRRLLAKPASLQVSEALAKMAMEAQALVDVEPRPSAHDPLPEFLGVLLALQSCQQVDVFGMPRALSAAVMRGATAPGGADTNTKEREPYFKAEGAAIFDTRDSLLADRKVDADAHALDVDAAILQLLELRGYVTIVD